MRRLTHWSRSGKTSSTAPSVVRRSCAHSWLRLCWGHRRNRSRLYIIVVRKHDQPVLIAPLIRRGRSLTFLDSATPQYNDVLVEESAATSKYLEFLLRILPIGVPFSTLSRNGCATIYQLRRFSPQRHKKLSRPPTRPLSSILMDSAIGTPTCRACRPNCVKVTDGGYEICKSEVPLNSAWRTRAHVPAIWLGSSAKNVNGSTGWANPASGSGKRQPKSFSPRRRSKALTRARLGSRFYRSMAPQSRQALLSNKARPFTGPKMPMLPSGMNFHRDAC